MKRDKRGLMITVLALVLALVIGLAACGQGNDGANNNSTTPSETTTETEGTNETETTSENETTTQTTTTVTSTTSGITVPDGFTERDFDIGYSDYETIALSGNTATTDASGVTVSGNTVTITAAGSYLLAGELNGQIVVDVPGTDDKVQLILDNATITNGSSAAIYVLNADKVFFTTTDGSVNNISTTGAFVQTDENAVDGAIFSKDDIVFNGQGTLVVTAAEGHAIVSKDDLKITSGTYKIDAAYKGLSANDLIGIAGGDIMIEAGDDGINSELDVTIFGGTIAIAATDDAVHADSTLTVEGGTIDVVAAEGMESTLITINDGEITINASDDGINAAQKVTDYTPTIEVNGGNITINMAAGDTDAMDSNGYLYINGGVINISAQFPFDYDIGGAINGGEVYVNGQQVTDIYNAMMGGGFGGQPGGQQGGWGGQQGGWGGQQGGGRP